MSIWLNNLIKKQKEKTNNLIDVLLNNPEITFEAIIEAYNKQKKRKKKMDKQEALNQAWYELRDSLNPKDKLWPIIMKLKAAIDIGEGLESKQFSKSDFDDALLRQKEGAKVFAKEMDELGRELSKKGSGAFSNLNLKGSPFDFNKVLGEMQKLYEIKNHDYGNSFSETIQEFGFTPAIARINDKLKRVKQMVKGEQMLVNESMRDNLIDIANYCVLTIIELDKNK